MRSSGESIIAAGGAPLGVPDIVLREEDVLDGVQEFGVKFIGAADEAVPVQCPVDAQTRVCESSRSGRRSASYDASTKEQNPKGGARNGCMPNASQPISAEISPVTGACHKGGARDGSPRNLFPDRWLCVLPGWQMNVNVNVNVRNLFPTESAPKKKPLVGPPYYAATPSLFRAPRARALFLSSQPASHHPSTTVELRRWLFTFALCQEQRVARCYFTRSRWYSSADGRRLPWLSLGSLMNDLDASAITTFSCDQARPRSRLQGSWIRILSTRAWRIAD